MRSLAHTLGFAHVIAFAALILASSSALAQTIGVAPAAKSEAQITKPQTEAAVRDLLSKLDDAKVRELLVDEWSKQARERAQALAAKEQRSLPDLLASYGSALSRSLTAHLEGASKVPGVIGSSLSRFSVERGSAPLTSLFGRLLLALGLGSCAAVVFRLATRALESQILSARPETLWRKVGLVVGRLALHLGQISLFFVTGFIVARAGGLGPDFSTIVAILTAAAWVWVAIALSRFVMAPERPELRLCPFDDKTAKFLTFRTALIAALAGGGFGFVSWLAPYRTESIETGSGFWISLALHLLVIVTLYQARHGIADMIRDGEEDNGGTLHRRWFPRIADAWPWISMALVAIQWLALEMVIALGELPLNVLAPALITMGLLISVPILDHGMRTILTSFAPMPETTSARTLAAHYETRRGLVRCSRVILGILLIVGLLRLWGIEVSTLAQQGVGARFAQALIEIALVLLVAYALWELVTIVVGRQIAIERAELATGDGDAHADGEGGKGETRLATVLPLFRLTAHIAIAILATLVIVSELGVNITPLLAGAGIVGLAIGFGAQTLVKDIISGLFFLIDDAFRKGEYIDIGTAKGTVEKIS
ncbi:MAG: mechanosensitive ion channel domain-containing protein, partial [Pseudomonadota bacterium]